MAFVPKAPAGQAVQKKEAGGCFLSVKQEDADGPFWRTGQVYSIEPVRTPADQYRTWDALQEIERGH